MRMQEIKREDCGKNQRKELKFLELGKTVKMRLEELLEERCIDLRNMTSYIELMPAFPAEFCQ